MSGRNSGYDRYISVFSPEGRLHQVEYAIKATKSSTSGIAVRGKDAVVIASQKKVTDKLIKPDSVTTHFKITNKIGCAMVGQIADAPLIVQEARHNAAEFAYANGYDIPVHWLADKMSGKNQMYTQHAYARVRGVMMLFFALDEESGPALYQVDPSGYISGLKAASIGAKDSEGVNVLEKKLKEDGEVYSKLGINDAIDEAIATLQKVLHEDCKATELEVSVVDANGFKTLSIDEIGAHLEAIAEKE